ncbi:MAG TPA: AsmA family protein [Gallionellaceae bacterium]|nr:AsmA family protein [Gallionellaceae bacterium]
MKSIKNALLGLFGIIGLSVSMFGLFKVPFAESAAKEYWRQALVAILLILGLIAGVIALFIYTFDANNFKSQIIQYVKEHKQRDLTLEGDIKVTFFPKLGLNSGRMALSERNSSKGFASIDNVRLYVAWFPLLRKQLEVDRITLEGVHANVVRYKDGSSNLDDLLIHDSSLDNTRFDIDGVTIGNSSVEFLDEGEGLHFSLRDLHLETGRLTDSMPSNLNATFRFEADKPHVSASSKLASHLFFERKTGHYELANFEGRMEGEGGGVSNLALSFEGTLNGFPSLGTLTFDKLQVSAKGKLDTRDLDARLDLPKLQINRDRLSGSKLDLTLKLAKADENLSANLQAPAFELAQQVLQCAECALDLDLKQSDRALQARLNSPLNINVETQQWLLPKLAGRFKLSHPSLATALEGKANGKLSVDGLEQALKGSVEATVGDSQMTATLNVKGFNQPAYNFDIGIDQLDLDRYLAADWSKRVFDSPALLDLPTLKALKLRGSLRVDEFRFAKLKMRKLMVDASADQGALQLDPVSADLYGGSLSGSLKLEAQDTPRLALKQKLNSIQLQPLLQDATGESRLRGKGALSLSLTAEGNSMAALEKSLVGNASLALGRGQLSGIRLGAALVEGKPALGMANGERSYSAKFSESTDFSELKSELEIGNGKVHSSELTLKSPLFVSKGEGTLQLDACSLDYHLDTTIAATLKRQSSGELADLKGISVPMRVAGTCAAPTLAVNFAAASGGNSARLIKANLAKAATTSADAPAANK